jgi:hypothetical protein
MGDDDALPRSAGEARRPPPHSADDRRGPAGGVTATEAGHGHRRSLTDWWRGRSWSKDLDTLSRLHKILQALDTGGDADAGAEPEPLTAPALPSSRPIHRELVRQATRRRT